MHIGSKQLFSQIDQEYDGGWNGFGKDQHGLFRYQLDGNFNEKYSGINLIA